MTVRGPTHEFVRIRYPLSYVLVHAFRRYHWCVRINMSSALGRRDAARQTREAREVLVDAGM